MALYLLYHATIKDLCPKIHYFTALPWLFVVEIEVLYKKLKYDRVSHILLFGVAYSGIDIQIRFTITYNKLVMQRKQHSRNTTTSRPI